jgi:DNA-binding response OmpR family regulator
MKTILFIEDESVLQKTFGEVLRKEGHKVVNALDGEAGLRLAKSEIPDLILLDLILPKMHGFEVLKELKSDKKTKDIPVMILTNLEGMEEVDKAVELGATTFLIKTHYSLSELLEKVKKILGE